MHARFRYFTTAIPMAWVLTGAVFAQSTNPVDENAVCNAQKVEVQKRMEIARSKGQMLLRQQLAEQLAVLQVDCKPLPASQTRAAAIERLEKKVEALRTELDTAQEQLHQLKSGNGR